MTREYLCIGKQDLPQDTYPGAQCVTHFIACFVRDGKRTGGFSQSAVRLEDLAEQLAIVLPHDQPRPMLTFQAPTDPDCNIHQLSIEEERRFMALYQPG